MSAREDMARLLQEWLQMTWAETEAIQDAAWPKLHEIQTQKARLREPLDQALEKWKSQESASSRGEASEYPFSAEVRQLIALEAHNAQLVADRQQKVRARQTHLDQAKNNLRRIRGSYIPPPPAAWNSFS